MTTDAASVVDVSGLLVKAESGTMSSWSDEKRKDFTFLFAQRAHAARAVLFMTAHALAERGVRAHYLSEASTDKVFAPTGVSRWSCRYPNNDVALSGREHEELLKVAEERAQEILGDLPAVRSAIKIIDPGTAKKMDALAKLKKELAELDATLCSLSKPIHMSDLPRETTIGEFLDNIAALKDAREVCLGKMNKVGTKAQDLERQIDKALIAGIPGIQEAVLDTIKALLDRAAALSQTKRRVEERVQFGDSTEALSILQRFEQDEITGDTDLKKKVKEAMAALQLNKKKPAAIGGKK